MHALFYGFVGFVGFLLNVSGILFVCLCVQRVRRFCFVALSSQRFKFIITLLTIAVLPNV